MNRLFWIVAALGVASIFYVQFIETRGPSKGFMVTGMSPQIDIIRNIASAGNWRIACEGTSGEMTALWVEPGFFADQESEIAVSEEISDVASATSPMKTANCSAEAPTVSVDDPTANPPLMFGDQQMLQPYWKLAKSCGFEEATISPIAEIDQASVPSEIPSNWMALYAGPGSANRYGPSICMVIMTPRVQAHGHFGSPQ